ncbi:MAG: molybdopterin-guanine dinucleotide biosynthesis protein B, partial [Myxococcales bacterium]|nr:molybdopterin-guanine dinucleotide biosynthesis protein B [Myxococcales bacterium]
MKHYPNASCQPPPTLPYRSLWPASCRLPIVGFAAVSGSGKTTLAKAVIAILRDRKLRIAVIKKSHHDFEVDRVGKDSYELRHAGAMQMVIGSPYRRALIVETPGAPEPTLDELITLLDQSTLDLILVEGYKHDPLPKIEVRRRGVEARALAPDDANVIAVASHAGSPMSLSRTDARPARRSARTTTPPSWALEHNRAEHVA